MIYLRNWDKLSVYFSRLNVNGYYIFFGFSEHFQYIWYIVDRALLRQASQVTVAFTSFGFWRTAWMHKVSWLTALELTEGRLGRALCFEMGFTRTFLEIKMKQRNQSLKSFLSYFGICWTPQMTLGAHDSISRLPSTQILDSKEKLVLKFSAISSHTFDMKLSVSVNKDCIPKWWIYTTQILFYLDSLEISALNPFQRTVQWAGWLAGWPAGRLGRIGWLGQPRRT